MRIRYHKRKKEVINLHAHELGTFPAQDWRHLGIFIGRLMTAKSMEERGVTQISSARMVRSG